MPDSLQPRNRDRRDRKSTEDLIIAAFEAVMLRDGVAGLGINVIAQEAGVNKVLIYRYFGDLPGLARRWAGSSSFWPSELELIGNDPEAFAKLTVEERVRKVMRNYVDAIRSRPRTIELLATELLSSTDVTRAIMHALAKPASALGHFTCLDQAERDLTDQVWKLIYLIKALTAYLTIRERSNPVYLGHDLTSEEAWAYTHDIVDEMTVRFLKD